MMSESVSESAALPIGTRYPFPSRYAKVNGHRLHYIDQGSGDPIVWIHGNPTWSYTWRNVIPHLEGDARCIAVDLIGMGRSEQPDIGYTFLEHVDYIERFVLGLGLRRIVFAGHDWGAPIGLQVACRHPDLVKGIVMAEPQALRPMEDWSAFSPPEAVGLFRTLRDPEQGWLFMRENSIFIEGMTRTIISRPIAPEEHASYREPFVDPDKRKPMWVFPNQIPVCGSPAEVVEAVSERNRWLTSTPVPKLLAYATPGCNVREPQLAWCREHLPNLTTHHIGEGFHYLTEENPHSIGQAVKRWYRDAFADV